MNMVSTIAEKVRNLQLIYHIPVQVHNLKSSIRKCLCHNSCIYKEKKKKKKKKNQKNEGVDFPFNVIKE